MNRDEAYAVTRLIAHLDGSIQLDPTDLSEEVAWLFEQATTASGVRVALDEQALADTLGQVAQRFADGGS